MTVSVDPAETEAELATFLAIGAEVRSGPWADAATLAHELATGSCSRGSTVCRSRAASGSQQPGERF